MVGPFRRKVKVIAEWIFEGTVVNPRIPLESKGLCIPKSLWHFSVFIRQTHDN